MPSSVSFLDDGMWIDESLYGFEFIFDPNN